MTRMTWRNWGLATLIAGLVIWTLLNTVAQLPLWAWWIPPTVGLILVFVGIALLVSTRFKSEKKALT